MNDTNLIAVAIVAAEVIVKLPIGPQLGRYQMAGGGSGPTFLVNMTSSDTSIWMGVENGWKRVSSRGGQ